MATRFGASLTKSKLVGLAGSRDYYPGSLFAPHPPAAEAHLCNVCHAGALKSTQATDNLLPNPAVCAAAIKTQNRSRLPRVYTCRNSTTPCTRSSVTSAPTIAKAVDSGAYLGKPADVHRPDLNTYKCLCRLPSRAWIAPTKSATRISRTWRIVSSATTKSTLRSVAKSVTSSSRRSSLPPTRTTGSIATRRRRCPRICQSCAVCHGRRFTCLGCH